MNFDFRLCNLAITALFLLGGCGSAAPTDRKVMDQSQQLLEAQGPLALVEQNHSNPLQANMQARQKVRPGQLANSSPGATSPGAGMDEQVHFKVLKLERQMADLQDDFDRILPPLSDLVVSDVKLDETISDIQRRRDREARAAAPVSPAVQMPKAPAAKPAEETVSEIRQEVRSVNAPASPEEGDVKVTGIRLGDHPGKVRIVLDLTAPLKFSYDLDNNERILLIDVPGASWAADASKIARNALITDVTAQQNSSGRMVLVMEIARPVKVISSTSLPPGGAYGYRIVIDIAPL